jgi:hypothetical protein
MDVPPDEEIYVHQPHGFKRGEGTEVLCLWRTLYGLRQSPQYFYKYFTEHLVRQGLTPSSFDPCLFMTSSMIVIIYVDDILVYGKSMDEINDFINPFLPRCAIGTPFGCSHSYLPQ